MPWGVARTDFALTEGCDPQHPGARNPLLSLPQPKILHVPDEAAADALGAALGGALVPGDTVLLSGPLGAGKSALARAAIRRMLNDPGAEVPSPSYTLVNVYDSSLGPVWHVDLYRLGGGADEMAELGLDEALGHAVVLIEWPDRLGRALPGRHLSIRLCMRHDGGRDAVIEASGSGWDRALAALGEDR